MRLVAALGMVLALATVVRADDPPIVRLDPDDAVIEMRGLGDVLLFITQEGDRWYGIRRAPVASPTATELIFADAQLEFVGVQGPHMYFRDALEHLWRTDGSVAGTTPVSDGVAYDALPVPCGGSLYYGGPGWTLHRTDGTPGASEAVASTGNVLDAYQIGCVNERLVLVNSTTRDHVWPNEVMEALGAVQFNGTLGAGVFGDHFAYVRIRPSDADPVLFRTDGTVEETIPLVEPPVPLRNGLAVAGDRVFYTVEDPMFPWRKALMASDGEPGDAREVGSIMRGGTGLALGTDLAPLVSLGDVLVYQADVGITGSDGTSTAGTAILIPLQPFVSPTRRGSLVTSWVEAGGVVYFGIVGDSAFPYSRVARTDGTPAGSATIAQFHGPLRLAVAGGTLFVIGRDEPVIEPPSPCAGADDVLACELDGLVASLTCDGGATSALRRKQARKLIRLARRLGSANATAASRAERRATAVLEKLEQRFVGRAAVARLGAECASAMAGTVRAARARIADVVAAP